MARIGGFDLMILINTKITEKAYFRHKMGYDVLFSEAPVTAYGDAQGGVVVIV